MTYFIGFDPGGKNAFGWAVLEAQGNDALVCVESGTCNDAPNALAAAESHIKHPPLAFATDAPLFWVTAGDRNSDATVRNLVCAAGGKSGTVNHVNSLRGACLVQGVLIAKFASEIWPNALITEAHPKALRLVSKAAQRFEAQLSLKTISSDHERDAALAGYAAWALVTNSVGWHDLVRDEENAFFPMGKSVAYWFPEDIS